MRSGIWILNLFAALWCVAAVVGGELPLPVLIVPVAISGALITWGYRATANFSEARNPRIGRLVGIWSAVEGVTIFLAINVCRNIGAPNASLPVVAIIVGLHFLPLARGFPRPLYYATGTGLVVIGVIALLLPGADRYAFTGFGSAIILWISCVALALGATLRSPVN